MKDYDTKRNNTERNNTEPYKGLWVIDVEQFKNFHSLCAINILTNERRDFVIHESRDDRIAYLGWLKRCEGWITFNGIRYDYPLVHNILENKSFFLGSSVDRITSWLYRKSKSIIEGDKPIIYDDDAHILQHDLFKINHYDRPQRSCSLKWLEFSLRWNNLRDLPLHPDTIVEASDIHDIIRYNYNDVEATLMFWNYCQSNIQLRKSISSTYGINARNMSDTSVGTNILRKYYSDFTGIEYDKFKDLRDNTYIATFRDIISDKIEFSTPELKKLLRELKNNPINLLSKKFHKIIEFDNVRYDMAKGGLHTNMPPIVIEEDNNHLLVDMDFGR